MFVFLVTHITFHKAPWHGFSRSLFMGTHILVANGHNHSLDDKQMP